jgi:hypothetical protein
MSDSDTSEVQKLIRLKRHERPPEGYYEDFLFEFQQRQRVEMLRRSSFSLWLEKVATWFSSFGSRKWVYAGGAADAAFMIAAYMKPEPTASPEVVYGSEVNGTVVGLPDTSTLGLSSRASSAADDSDRAADKIGRLTPLGGSKQGPKRQESVRWPVEGQQESSAEPTREL